MLFALIKFIQRSIVGFDLFSFLYAIIASERIFRFSFWSTMRSRRVKFKSSLVSSDAALFKVPRTKMRSSPFSLVRRFLKTLRAVAGESLQAARSASRLDLTVASEGGVSFAACVIVMNSIIALATSVSAICPALLEMQKRAISDISPEAIAFMIHPPCDRVRLTDGSRFWRSGDSDAPRICA